jgi:hypothetical protein
MGTVIGILLFLFFGGVIVFSLFSEPDSDADNSEHLTGWHHAYGKWRVRYPDGKISQPFNRQVAEDYKEMFGGEIIPR